MSTKSKPKTAVDNVIFDIGGVILHVDFLPPVTAFSRECGLSPEEVMRGVLTSPELEAFDRGRVTPEEFFDALRRRFQIRMDQQRMERLWSEIFRENAGVGDLIRGWSGHVPMFLISNTCRSHVEQFERQFDLFTHFRDRIYSCDVGMMKPEREMYDLAISQFGVDPAKSLFIDDRQDNVEGARVAGLQAIRFTDAESLLHDLRQFGLA